MQVPFSALSIGGLPFGLTLEDAVLLVGLVGYASWWAIELRRGSKISRLALAFHITIYCLFALWVWASGIVALYRDGLASNPYFALTFLFLVPIPFIVALVVGYRFARRRLVFDRSEAGRWTYHGAATVPVLWVLLWFVRLGLEDGVLHGYSVFTGPFLGAAAPAAVPVLTFGLTVTFVVGLYFGSFGFLIGFSLAVWGRYHSSRKEFESGLPAWNSRTGWTPSQGGSASAPPRWVPTLNGGGSYGVSGARSASGTVRVWDSDLRPGVANPGPRGASPSRRPTAPANRTRDGRDGR